MQRLTEAILQRAPQYVNPVGDREMDLRGHNLATLDRRELEKLNPEGLDSMDLSANVLTALDNFPSMPRLTTIIAHNNSIAKIDGPRVASALPNLHSLVMHNNNIRNLNDLKALASFKHLERLSFIGNEVAKLADYRLFVISRCPKLKLLDFNSISDAERAAARGRFPPEAADAAAIEKRKARELRRKRNRGDMGGQEMAEETQAASSVGVFGGGESTGADAPAAETTSKKKKGKALPDNFPTEAEDEALEEQLMLEIDNDLNDEDLTRVENELEALEERKKIRAGL